MSKKKLRILSIDGGGTRGIIPATILNCIFEETGKSPVDFFDIFAGTSTGGIIILSLGVGRKTYEIMELYLNGAKDIFKDNKIDDIRDIGNLIGAQYSQKKLTELLKEAYENQTMGDLNDRYDGKKHFMIPTFCLNPTDSKGRTHNFRPEVFNSYYIKCNNENLVDLALRSSAAPTYFPMYQNYVDGGVAINHPAMAAVSYAINHHQSSKKSYCYHAPNKKGLERDLKDLKVLSLGCGTSNGNYIPEEAIQTGDWGILQWKDFLADMLVETNISASEYYVKQVLAPENYMRCQLYFDDPATPDELRKKKIPMDVTDKKKLKAMKKYAIDYFDKNKKKIMDFIEAD